MIGAFIGASVVFSSCITQPRSEPIMSAQIVEIPAARYSALTDMPADLTREEHKAYVAGYARGCLAYVRKHGAASVSTLSTGDSDAPLNRDAHASRVASLDVDALHAVTREHESARHPSAHKSGMAALRAYGRRYGTPAHVDPATPVAAPVARRKRAARTLVAVPDVAPVAAPVAVDVPDVAPMTRAARKSARRALAADMRAQGIRPSGEAWENEKAARNM